jgi:hypothetical protein
VNEVVVQLPEGEFEDESLDEDESDDDDATEDDELAVREALEDELDGVDATRLTSGPTGMDKTDSRTCAFEPKTPEQY